MYQDAQNTIQILFKHNRVKEISFLKDGQIKLVWFNTFRNSDELFFPNILELLVFLEEK